MMATRRDLLKYGVAAGGSSLLLSRSARAQNTDYLQYLCPPDNLPRDLADQSPSPPATPFKDPLFIPKVMRPMNAGQPGVDVLKPPADPKAHQRYNDFKPRKFYEIHEKEFSWVFHSDEPYNRGSLSWGFQGRTADGKWLAPPSAPGPTYHARYGDPVLVRRYNSLPPVGQSAVTFALPSTTTHLHNGHTASESDGSPQDWIDSGEFWDHHYGNFPSGMDPREKLTTLWYHDHRMDFTAANVYAGLFGFYLLFDDNDTGDENDTRRGAWRLPSGDYDIPLIIQDIQFVKQKIDGVEHAEANFQNWNTDGMLGDMMTVNRIIMPHFEVEPRKYRFRILNGGPSRFYQICLRGSRKVAGTDRMNFKVITGDGNFLPEPVMAENLYMSVAQRYDVILDFSAYQPGDTINMYNLLEQTNGRGPTSRLLEPGEVDQDGRHLTELMQFRVVASKGKDNSRVPDYFRPLPTYDLKDVKRHRVWNFDYDGGLWTINGRIFDPNRIDAGIDQGSLEIWTLRNGGSDWSHPIHSHFTEFILLEVNGKKVEPRTIEDASGRRMSLREYLGTDKPPIKIFMGGFRRDVATILPNDELKVVMRWQDFLGKYVMHCHNVVHEDHAMMIRWDIMEPGRGFDEPRKAEEVYGPNGPEPVPFPDPRPPSKPHQEIHPSNPVQSEG